MVASLLFLIILDIDSLAALFILVVLAQILLILVLVVWLQASLSLEVLLSSLVATFSSKSSSGFTHLIKEVVTTTGLAFATWLRIIVVIEDLFVLRSLLIKLQVLDHLLVLLLPLHLLQVVLVQLVFKVVDVRELLYVDSVETLKFRL